MMLTVSNGLPSNCQTFTSFFHTQIQGKRTMPACQQMTKLDIFFTKLMEIISKTK